MVTLLKKLWREEEGAGLVEYALLIVLIALIATAGMFALGGGLNDLFSNIGTTVGGATVDPLPN